VGDHRWFFRDEQEWSAFAERLKLTSCPHCKVVGTLIRHGFLYGLNDACPPRQTVRARRIFCSNRRRRTGCGRTFSVWIADKIRRLSVTTRTLWRFLQLAVAGTIAAAIRAVDSPLSDRAWQRIWKRSTAASPPSARRCWHAARRPICRPRPHAVPPPPKFSPIFSPRSQTLTVRSRLFNIQSEPSSCESFR